MNSLSITTEQAHTRLDVLISQRPDIASRELAKRLINKGLVKVNGSSNKLKAASILKAGDQVEYEVEIEKPFLLQPIAKELEIHYEDDQLLVVYKPAGIVTHPSLGHFDESLTHYLAQHTNLAPTDHPWRPGIVHRLDKDTSGLLVVAKNSSALAKLSRQFAEKKVSRSYYAIVWGRPTLNFGTIAESIARCRYNRKKFAVAKNGKPATTHWQLLKTLPEISLLKCNLETGRTHQIRVHLSFIGLPVVGDLVYGKRKIPRKNLTTEQIAVLTASRYQCLHAFKLGFLHPETALPLSFERSLPDNMAQILRVFTKSDNSDADSTCNSSG